MNAFRFIILVGIGVSLLGCAAERAMRPTKVSFIPEVVRTLGSRVAPQIKLTDSQVKQTCSALRGSLQSDFCNDQMQAEVLAGWWNVRTNAIAIFRIKKDGSGSIWISFDQQGNLLADGGGREMTPPWTK